MTISIRSIMLLASVVPLSVGCSAAGANAGGGQAAQTAATPEWTGRTMVLGSNSTVGGDAAATELQRKWELGRGR